MLDAKTGKLGGLPGHHQKRHSHVLFKNFPGKRGIKTAYSSATSRQTPAKMPYYRKRGDTWRAEVERMGIRRSATFGSKAEAVAWASQVESEAFARERGEISSSAIVADLLDRYAKEVTPLKKGKRWEEIRINALRRDTLAQVRLRKLDAPHVADWQQRRSKEVSDATVRRERGLLSSVFNIAVREWRMLRENPFVGVRKPKDSRPRERIATDEEIALLLGKASPSMRKVIVWALETGMRAGEIAALRHINGRVARLEDTKNDTARDVPLSPRALEVWADGGFGLTAGSISALFARLTTEAGVEGLTFHDLRRTFISRIARERRLEPFELARMVGHKDLKMTLRYYQMNAEDIAGKL